MKLIIELDFEAPAFRGEPADKKALAVLDKYLDFGPQVPIKPRAIIQITDSAGARAGTAYISGGE